MEQIKPINSKGIIYLYNVELTYKKENGMGEQGKNILKW